MKEEKIKYYQEKTRSVFHILEYRRFWDYITNLQEENRQTKLLKERYQLEKEIYKSRNEKAIEYIKQNSKCGGSFIDDKFVIEYIDEVFNGMELLNILNGGDEE